MRETGIHDMPIQRSERTDYLALEEVAELIGASESAIKKLIDLGRIEAIDIEEILLIPRSQVDLLEQSLRDRKRDGDAGDQRSLVDTGLLKAFAAPS